MEYVFIYCKCQELNIFFQCTILIKFHTQTQFMYNKIQLVIFPGFVMDMLDPGRDQETDTNIRHFL